MKVSVTQLVEYYTFNVGVAGPSPAGDTPKNNQLKIK